MTTDFNLRWNLANLIIVILQNFKKAQKSWIKVIFKSQNDSAREVTNNNKKCAVNSI